MNIKSLFSTMMIAVALMLVFMLIQRGGFFGGSSSTATGPYPIYDALPSQPKAFEHDDQGANVRPQTILLGGAQAKDNSLLAVQVNNVTAGIDSVQLNVKQFAQTYRRDQPLALFPNPNSTDPYPALPFATAGVHITVGKETRELSYGSKFYTADNGFLTEHKLSADDSAENISRANETNLLDAQYVWKVEKTSPTDVELSATFMQDGVKIAKITKHFHINPDSYEMTITHAVQNLTTEPIHVRIDQLTAPGLSRDDPQTDDRYFHAAPLNTSNPAKVFVDGDHGYNMAWTSLRKVAEAPKVDKNGKPVNPGTEFVGGVDGQFDNFAANPFLWVASANRFFTIIVRPLPESGNTTTMPVTATDAIRQPHHVGTANIDLMQTNKDKPADDLAIVRLTGRVIDVAPNATVDEPLSVFLGPKSRAILKGEAATLPGPTPVPAIKDFGIYQYSSLVQFNTCWLYSLCVSGWVVNSILTVLDFLKGTIAFGNYGIAIMILVIVVRAILHPLTRASQVNMAKMGKQMRDVQPQLEAMKKRYADNKKKQSEEMMRIYRENKINPAGGIMGCLPMLIQMPIWAALYAGLRSDIDLRHAAFIPGWINDLASPDKILPSGALVLGHPVFTLPLLGDVYGLNLLPLLLAAVFYFQMKVTTATQPPPADEQQAQMAKMSKYMIFLFPLMLYNAPSGLNLYIFASTMGGLLDTYLVRKTLRKQGILPTSAPLLPTHEDPKNESA